MSTILLTGATDGIGLETASHLADLGHRLIVHGRSQAKLDRATERLAAETPSSVVGAELADLSHLDQVEALAVAVADQPIDVIINNAGVYRTDHPITGDGLDIRFVVNTIAPYLLTRRLLPSLPAEGRIVNLSSAAQAPVDLDALLGRHRVPDMDAYAQSKLAITMWTKHLADELGPDGPAVIAVNPGSFLATKMVKEGFGMAGSDVGIGVDVLTRAALDDSFAQATGRYFDNDARRFAVPHPDAIDAAKNAAVVEAIESVISRVAAG
ncbi:MAG: SDR family NAD(P)-dependent oxidoreductase [Actinomycetota bacterium]